MTVWMLVSKQNIFTDEQLLTHSVLWSSIHHWTFPRFNKIKQEISHYDCFDPKCESLCSKKESPDFSCSEQNLYDFVILMIFLTLWWLYDDVHKTCLVFHVIVNISFSYDILLITTALIQSENHLTVSNHSTFPVLNKMCTNAWFRGKQYSQNSPVSFMWRSTFRFLTIYLFESSKHLKINCQHFVFLRFIYSKVASVQKSF